MNSNSRFFSLIDDLHKAMTCLSAMAILVEHVLRNGEDVRSISDGVWLLISGQTDILSNAIDALSREINSVYTDKLELRDLDQVAAMHGVKRDLVNRIISSAVGFPIAAGSAEAGKNRADSLDPATAGALERALMKGARDANHAGA